MTKNATEICKMSKRIKIVTPKELEQVIKSAEELIATATDEELPVIMGLLTKIKKLKANEEKMQIN